MTKSTLRHLLGLALLYFSIELQAQSGVTALSNRMTYNAAKFNPSAMVDPIPYLDGEILGLNLSINNNYVFSNETGLQLLLGSGLTADRNRNRNKARLYGEADIGLPGFTMSLGKYSIGWINRARSMVKANNLPIDLAEFAIEGFNYPEQFGQEYNSNNFFLKTMTWAESGLALGRIISQRGNFVLSGGVTLKLLFGLSAVGALAQNLSYEVDSQNIALYRFSGTYSYVTPGGVKTGFGTDLGLTFKKTKTGMYGHIPHSAKSRCTYVPYVWKAAISVLDVGRIKYTDNARSMTTSDLVGDLQGYPTANFSSLSIIGNTILDNFGQQNFNVENEVRGWLPLAVHMQYDYALPINFFANASALYAFNFRNSSGAARISYLSGALRYERKRFEAALPVSLFPYRNPRVGLMLRAFNFYIGTDNLLNLFLPVYGADVFFGFKFTIHQSGHCKPGQRPGIRSCNEPMRPWQSKKKTIRKSRELF